MACATLRGLSAASGAANGLLFIRNIQISPVHGVANTNLLQIGSSTRDGGVTNSFVKTYFEPAL